MAKVVMFWIALFISACIYLKYWWLVIGIIGFILTLALLRGGKLGDTPTGFSKQDKCQ
jgi:hypothetical protein